MIDSVTGDGGLGFSLVPRQAVLERYVTVAMCDDGGIE